MEVKTTAVSEGPTGPLAPGDVSSDTDPDAATASSPDGGSDSNSSEGPVIPEWADEKFRVVRDDGTFDADATAAKLAESYRELSSKMGANSDADTETGEAAKAALTSAGVDVPALQAEFDKDGQLSDASYDKLEGAGFDRATVDRYIEGNRALTQLADIEAERLVAECQRVLGGEQSTAEKLNWAAGNLSEEDLNFYNEQVSSGSIPKARAGAEWLAAKYNEMNAAEAGMIRDTSANTTTTNFNSWREVMDARSERTSNGKKRYHVDPAYRAEVDAKLSRSNL